MPTVPRFKHAAPLKGPQGRDNVAVEQSETDNGAESAPFLRLCHFYRGSDVAREQCTGDRLCKVGQSGIYNYTYEDDARKIVKSNILMRYMFEVLVAHSYRVSPHCFYLQKSIVGAEARIADPAVAYAS
ncbi:unnamed protein product [Lasius platythorax]|uniref:Uncharacterized protein n=1 Tax=Lasius platythorax TaxID=488582 RepID=A0AAV2N4T4_9HYME